MLVSKASLEEKQRTYEPSGQDKWGAFQRPLTLILLKKYRDTNGRRIVIQYKSVVYVLLSAKKKAYFCTSIDIEKKVYRDTFQKYRGQGSIWFF